MSRSSSTLLSSRSFSSFTRRALFLLGLLFLSVCVLSVNGARSARSVVIIQGGDPGDVDLPPPTSIPPPTSGSDSSSSTGGSVTPPEDSSSSDDSSSSEPSTGGNEQQSSSSSSTGGTVTPPEDSSSSSSGSDDDSSSGSGSEPSTGGNEEEESSSSSSSSTGGSVTPPEDSSSSSSGGSDTPSTGGSEESSSSSSSGGSVTPPASSSSSTGGGATGGGSGNVDCQAGTYSHNGFAPCKQCPNNTYANIRETSCTPCPVHTSCPTGAASLTECVCDNGYTSLWASGGPCYASNDSASYQWCGVGTYSSTGYGPNCESCGANSYANIGETECHACPANSHAPAGAASLTECMCDDGYTSKWASGGPCYKEGDDEPSTGGSNSTSCSSYTSGDACSRDTSCQSFYGHTCDNDRWSFIGCQDKATEGVCAPGISNSNSTSKSTCAKNADGDRAWFATECLPNGWSKAAVNNKCGSCCKPKNHPGGSGNIGGCTFANNSACLTLEYAGACPSRDVINVWRIKVIEAIAETVSSVMNISKSDATVGITINVMPRTNQGTTSCEVRVQIFAPKTGSLTANDFIEAIWQQYNEHGNDLLAQASSLTGVASYKTFGSLKPLDVDDVIPDVDDNTSGAITTSSLSSFVGIAMVASIIISM